jgi:hypothetical protein
MKLAFEKELRKAEKQIKDSSKKESSDIANQLEVLKKQKNLLEERHQDQLKALNT